MGLGGTVERIVGLHIIVVVLVRDDGPVGSVNEAVAVCRIDSEIVDAAQTLVLQDIGKGYGRAAALAAEYLGRDTAVSGLNCGGTVILLPSGIVFTAARIVSALASFTWGYRHHYRQRAAGVAGITHTE